MSDFLSSLDYIPENKIIEPKETFVSSLYTEYMEEASFLYEQRLHMRESNEFYWEDPEHNQKRSNLLIYGLSQNDDTANDLCNEKIIEGEESEFFVAVSVFCRAHRNDLLLDILDKTDFKTREYLNAFVDAVKNEFCPISHKDLITRLLNGNSEHIEAASKIAEFQRFDISNELTAILETKDDLSEHCISAIFKTLGRVGTSKIKLKDYFKFVKNKKTGQELFLSSLLKGQYKSLHSFVSANGIKEWLVIPLALCSDNSLTPSLLDFAVTNNSNDAVLALGLLGDCSVIDELIRFLSNEATAENASIALDLITGANIYEDIFIPDEIDEDMLFDEEIEKLKRGESIYPPGEEPGMTIHRISQNSETWKNWWDENRHKFNKNIKFRNGMPFSPISLIDYINSKKSHSNLRKSACEELIIRYNIDYHFDIEMTVNKQRSIIGNYLKWFNKNDKTFTKGDWCIK